MDTWFWNSEQVWSAFYFSWLFYLFLRDKVLLSMLPTLTWNCWIMQAIFLSQLLQQQGVKECSTIPSQYCPQTRHRSEITDSHGEQAYLTQQTDALTVVAPWPWQEARSKKRYISLLGAGETRAIQIGLCSDLVFQCYGYQLGNKDAAHKLQINCHTVLWQDSGLCEGNGSNIRYLWFCLLSLYHLPTLRNCFFCIPDGFGGFSTIEFHV